MTINTVSALLQTIYDNKEVVNMTELLKKHNLPRITTITMLNKGLIAKYRNGKQVSLSTKGRNLTYRWKHPQIRPMVTTSEELIKEINKASNQYISERKVKQKGIVIKNRTDLIKTDFYKDLLKLKERYEKEMCVQITLTAEITTTKTFEI